MSLEPKQTEKVGRIRRALKRWRIYVLPSAQLVLKTEAAHTRLHKVLEQSPQAYALWSSSGAFETSSQLLRWLNVPRIANINDILNALLPADAIALEGLWQRLERDGQPFSLRAKTRDEQRSLGISAERQWGQDDEKLLILWLTDLTAMTQNVTIVQTEKQALQDVIDTHVKRLTLLPMPVWVRDETGKLTWCNESYAQLVETNIETSLGEQRELMGAKSAIARSLAERARNERLTVTEKHPLVIGGERRLMQITEMLLEGTNQTLGLAHDMTVLEEMQSELRRFRASTQELLRALNTGIAIFNPKTQITFYNDAFVRLFLVSEAFLDDKPSIGEVMEALREKRRLPEQADFKSYKKQWQDRFTSLIAPHEEMMHLPDGTAIRMLVVPHPLGGLFMTFEDVTSRLALESSYNTLIAVQRETIDNLAEGLAVWRSDARLALYNPAFAQLWSFTPQDLDATPHASTLVGKLQNFFAAENWDHARDVLQQATLNREASNGRLVLQDGRVVEYATIPLPDGGMLNRFNDVSDTLKVEHALREKNAALEQAERLKLDFLANVSYQLRTPLNAMMGFSEVLEKQYFGPMNERQLEYAAGMTQAGEKLIGLVNDILDLSTIEAGYLALQFRSIDIMPMVKSLYDLTHEWARKQHINMVLHCPPNIGTMEADERRLKQVLLNLISNAITFTPENGQIDFTIERRDAHVAFILRDTGIGISKEDQQKIFSPFVRLHQNQRNTGAGLGLSLVKSIVELHGGDITLESDVGSGTIVTCLIPVRQAKKA